ncbi:hypothetical protein ACFSJS_22715 [Streptomyces desertarenae]|uniref:Uncharacterized protein n=1 Tax=Streptomyces desertarenae TaxID=2666184 RepID=A0ABW4PNU6_9ACTN
MKRPAADGTTRCPTCRAPTLRQTVGHTAALTITADLQPLTPQQQADLWEPNRLTWCLVTIAGLPPRLRWIHPWHPAQCPHPHVTEHRCPHTATLF